jgi:hypothetical protein
MADAAERVDTDAGEAGSSSEEEPPPPPPEAANLNEHLMGEGWMMKKSRQLKGRFQKRYFRVDGESLSHYANNGVSKTVRAVAPVPVAGPPLPLALPLRSPLLVRRRRL